MKSAQDYYEEFIQLDHNDLFAGKRDEKLVSEETKKGIYQLKKNELKARVKEEKALARKLAKEQAIQLKEDIVRQHQEQVTVLFALWQELFDRPRSGLTKVRRWHLSLALEKFTPVEVELVLRVAAADPNTRGQNKLNRPFDDLDNILRNEARIEMYLKMAQLKGTNLTPSGVASKGERI